MVPGAHLGQTRRTGYAARGYAGGHDRTEDSMDRLSPQDASFLHIEDAGPLMHIGSVAIFEGPPPTYDEMSAMVGNKLGQVPRYRQKVRTVPFDLERPVWVDDPHFRLAYHLRRTALPSPGSPEQLRALVGRIMSQRLDREKPLWEMWMVEGLHDDRWALLSKVHHCLVDGVAGTDLLALVLDVEPEPQRPAETTDGWSPGPEPTGLQLLGAGLRDRITSPYEQLRGARALLRAPLEFARLAEESGRGLFALRRLLNPTAHSSLSGPIGPHRVWAWACTSLDDVKAVRKVFGGTVNDVILTTITRGFRDLLLSRGEPVGGTVVRSLVPVSVRRPDERGTHNNRVSAMFADLPVGIDDPVERLRAIEAQMRHLKDSKMAVAGETLVSLSGFAPPLLLALGARVAARASQRNINTVTTNVPGPQFPLYAAGRRMTDAFPYVPIGNGIRIGVAIFSYCGALNVGVTGDYESAGDIDVLCAGVEDGLAELVKAAKRVA